MLNPLIPGNCDFMLVQPVMASEWFVYSISITRVWSTSGMIFRHFQIMPHAGKKLCLQANIKKSPLWQIDHGKI